MGIDARRFSGPVSPDLLCSLCGGVLQDPLATPCGHVFCAGCVLPWVELRACCPFLGGENVACGATIPSVRDLHHVLPLRSLVLSLPVLCDHDGRGCETVVPLRELGSHLDRCDYTPVPCRNPGCREMVNCKDHDQHQRELCPFRPAGVCQQGCGLTLTHKDASSTEHDCIKALQNLVSSLQLKLSRADQDDKKRAVRFSKREKALLAQIATLQSEIHMQALRFQKKITDYRAQIDYFTRRNWQPGEEQRLTVILERVEGMLGFNIMGGNVGDGISSEGIYVSRIVEKGPADEQGKLRIHDRIMQVNGKDLSKASHEESVEAFRTAKEPIIVEVVRRSSVARQGTAKPDRREPCLVDAAVQTDIGPDPYYMLGMYRPPTPPPLSMQGTAPHPYGDPMLYDAAEDLEFADDLPPLDDNYNIEYEEVTLCRTTSEDKLGLTLCYGTDEEEDLGIYVSEIDPLSVAGKSGRIREGDHIVQINGEEVLNKDHAVRLFSEDKSEIKLLVARPDTRFDESWLEEERNMILDELNMHMLEQHHSDAMRYTAAMLDYNECRHSKEEEGTTDSATSTSNQHEKDSGVGRTDESTKNDESSEQDLGEDQSSHRLGSGELRNSNSSFTSNEQEFGQEITAEQCAQFQKELERKCNESYGTRDTGTLSDVSERELEVLNRRMEGMSFHTMPHYPRDVTPYDNLYENIMYYHQRNTPDVLSSYENLGHGLRHPGPHSVGPKPDIVQPEMTEIEKEDKQSDNSSSAYNTGESCRSTPLTLEFSVDSCKRSDTSSENVVTVVSTQPTASVKVTETSKDSRPSQSPVRKLGKPDSVKDLRSRSTSREKEGKVEKKHKDTKETQKSLRREKPPRRDRQQEQSVYFQPRPRFVERDSVYFQPRNRPSMYASQQSIRTMSSMCTSQMSIPVHAQHYRSYMHLLKAQEREMCRKARQKEVEKEQPREQVREEEKPEDDGNFEWKVKIRSDGSRYITRRPVRDRLLKERAMKIQEERMGLTTDDEAISEMKLGRYWTREERREHLQRAKDQKRRREFMERARLDILKESNNENPILEMSQKKMSKKGKGKIMDNFMTVQELLAQRVTDGSKTLGPLVTLTTV
ncbi:E3 ubiquitin-protein ligase PDZRN3-like [Branchiostoma floridae x Branchiostoma japonicum]